MIQVLFPIMYCFVVIVAIYFVHWGLSNQKLFSAKPEATIQPTPILVGAGLLVVDFIALAIVNYNKWFWLKIIVTLFVVSVAAAIYALVRYRKNTAFSEYNTLLTCAAVTLVLFVVSIAAAGLTNHSKGQAVQTSYKSEIMPIGIISNERDLHECIAEDQGIYVVCLTDNKGSYNYTTIPKEDTNIYYIGEGEHPYIVLTEERNVYEWKTYGKLHRYAEDKAKNRYDIFIPAGSTVGAYTPENP